MAHDQTLNNGAVLPRLRLQSYTTHCQGCQVLNSRMSEISDFVDLLELSSDSTCRPGVIIYSSADVCKLKA